MVKENVVYTYDRTLFNTDEPGEHDAMWNKPDIEGQILHDSTYMKYLRNSQT